MENQQIHTKTHLCLIGNGSRGDIQPLIAFGLTLRQSSVFAKDCLRISIITNIDFQEWIEELNFEYLPIKSSSMGILQNKDCVELIALGKTNQVFKEHCDENLVMNQVTDTVKALEKIQPDYIICNQATLYYSQIFKEKVRAPYAMIGFIPFHPTGDFPHPFIFSSPFWFRFLNSLSYVIYDKFGLTPYFAPMIKRIRQNHGIEEEFSGNDLVSAMLNVPTFYAISPSVILKPQDWPDNTQIGGYLFLDQQNESLDTSLKAFLDNGTPPIYYGFGSMPMELSTKFLSLLKGLRDHLPNERFLIFASLKTIPEEVQEYIKSDPNMMLIGSTCHRLLFPRCKCIIHHGGAGTTAAVVRSGTPSVPCTTFVDQPFWGNRLVSIGVSPDSIQFSSVNSKILSEAVLKACKEPYISNAKALSKKIKEEIGNENAVKWFLNWKNSVDNHAAGA